MSYYNQNQPPVGVPPPQGYPQEGYGKDSYPPQGYPPQGYPPQGYPPQYAGQPPPHQQSSSNTGLLQGCLGNSPIAAEKMKMLSNPVKGPPSHGGSEGVFGKSPGAELTESQNLAALCCCCLLDACF